MFRARRGGERASASTISPLPAPWQAHHAEALGSGLRAYRRRRAAGPARSGEATLRVGAGTRRETTRQASPVERGATPGSLTGRRCPASARRRGRAGTGRPGRAVLQRIEDAAPRSSYAAETSALRLRCHAEKDAAADRRHEQVLTEWQAQPWQLRQITARPRREPPDPPDRHDLAAARYELAGVVSSAMMTELDRLMPQRRPASPLADAARTLPAATSTGSSVLANGSATFRSTPRTRRPQEPRAASMMLIYIRLLFGVSFQCLQGVNSACRLTLFKMTSALSVRLMFWIPKCFSMC